MKKNNRVGERFKTNEGYIIEIIEYNNRLDLLVQFQDKYKAIVPSYYHKCKDGGVSNLYHKSLLGVGCLGLMSDGSKPNTITHKREYNVWRAMITRCYDKKYHELEPTYKDASVCKRWLIFANFLEDLPLIEGYDLWLEHPNERIALDKDIKGNGSKVYCLENCCFVTQSDNNKEVNIRTKRIKIYGINVKTGERTKDFNSIKEASREMGLKDSNISACFKGRLKTCGGYKWFKVEKESE